MRIDWWRQIVINFSLFCRLQNLRSCTNHHTDFCTRSAYPTITTTMHKSFLLSTPSLCASLPVQSLNNSFTYPPLLNDCLTPKNWKQVNCWQSLLVTPFFN
ncbi:hypothetical protein Ancab_008049 [Ancistrocladus abbreviatus]